MPIIRHSYPISHANSHSIYIISLGSSAILVLGSSATLIRVLGSKAILILGSKANPSLGMKAIRALGSKAILILITGLESQRVQGALHLSLLFPPRKLFFPSA